MYTCSISFISLSNHHIRIVIHSSVVVSLHSVLGLDAIHSVTVVQITQVVLI